MNGINIHKNTIIALAGKGGTGKTSLAALMVKLLVENTKGPVLAIDADPSACLARAIGMQAEESLGDIREESLEKFRAFQPGLSKREYLEMRVQEAIAEGRGLDLLNMGIPEGPGCYCFINNLIRENLDRLNRSYPYIVIDCEAGMEHFSRRTAARIDYLCLVTNLSGMGLAAVKSILELTRRLETRIGEKILFLNRLKNQEEGEKALEMLADLPGEAFSAVITLPEDEAVMACDLSGQPLIALQPDSPIVSVLKEKVHFI